MLQTTLSRLARGATAALVMFALAGPALAGHDDDWGRDDDRRAYPVHRHGDHCDRDWDRGYDRGDWDRYQRGGHGGYYDQRDHRGGRSHYACSCGRRWESRDHLIRHMRRHHHESRGWQRG